MNFFITIVCFILFTAAVGGQGWKKIPHGMTTVSAGLNYVWGVNKADNIFICQRPCNGNWKQVPGALVQLDVDEYEVWGVNSADSIFFRPVDGSGNWKQISGQLIHVSASGNGYVWGTNRAHQIYKCKKPCRGGWIRVAGGLVQIDGGQREVCGVNSNNDIYCRPVDGSGNWRHVPGKAIQVTTSGPYDMYAISPSKKMYRCRKPCIGQWIESELLYHSFGQCEAAANGLFTVDSGLSVWRKDFPL